MYVLKLWEFAQALEESRFTTRLIRNRKRPYNNVRFLSYQGLVV